MNRSKIRENHIQLLIHLWSKVANTVDPVINPDDVQHMERNVQSAAR